MHVGSIQLDDLVNTGRDLPVNLHDFWEGYLLEAYRAGDNRPSWWKVGNRLWSEFRERKKFEFRSLVSRGAAYRFACEIMSETATEVPCRYAYTDENWKYIEPNDVLSTEYIGRSIGIVRLAQLLNLAAKTNYAAIDTVGTVRNVSFISDNTFEILRDDIEWDPAEMAYYVALEDEDDQVAIPAVPVAPMHRPKRGVLDGVIWDEVFLIRRRDSLIITYKHLVFPIRLSHQVSCASQSSKRQALSQ